MDKFSEKAPILTVVHIEQMKYEIANEFGVNLGADATSRENGQVGGEITRRLVKMAKNSSNNNE